MGITLYAVGNNIQLTYSPNWFVSLFFPATYIPTPRDDIPVKEIILSLTSCDSTQYYDDEECAAQYARACAKTHPLNQIFVSCPAVYAVDAEKIGNKYQVTHIYTAKILKKSSEIPYRLNQLIVRHPKSWLNFFETNRLTCTPANFVGNFSLLGTSEETALSKRHYF